MERGYIEMKTSIEKSSEKEVLWKKSLLKSLVKINKRHSSRSYSFFKNQLLKYFWRSLSQFQLVTFINTYWGGSSFYRNDGVTSGMK